MEFRKVTAIIRPGTLENVETALQAMNVPGVSVTKVKGYGEYVDFYSPDWMCTHLRVKVFIGEHRANEVAEVIMGAAHTGMEAMVSSRYRPWSPSTTSAPVKNAGRMSVSSPPEARGRIRQQRRITLRLRYRT